MSCYADVMKGSIAAMHALVYVDVVQSTTGSAVSFVISHNSSQHNSSPYTMHMLFLCSPILYIRRCGGVTPIQVV
jgi:hypothetical protein